MASKYLLRFDDICPTMNWKVWDQVESALAEAGVQPIVAVVPDNKDRHLSVDPPAALFWDRVRRWQKAGWAIGLHGFEHRYVTASAGLLGRNPYSEFAGLPEQEQERKLKQGIAIFLKEGVVPDLWVAPAHSFDTATVRALGRLGITCISDGYARWPHRDAAGMLWIPQQIGRLRRMPPGVWTVCLHTNSWSGADIQAFREYLFHLRKDCVDLTTIKNTYGVRQRTWEDRAMFFGVRLLRRIKQLNLGGSGAHRIPDNA